ncbi:lipase 3-like [Solenopsis invicta]|nr:lipase 3-like [Solenopsis invicta]
MLLAILFISVLVSVNAGILGGLAGLISKWNPIDRIPPIPDLLSPNIPEDAQLTTMELITKNGFNGELHKVTTPDGYILELHRITGKINSTKSNVQKPVAFVMHGILCDSSSWVISGRNRSLAFILADEGYDVWLGNARGGPYANTHTNSTLDPKDYWNFSWHEIGTIDLPAMIDHIVETTGRKKMFYLGHSQGTTTFFVMASKQPEYQDYIEEMYAMAPIAYCGRMKSPFLQILAQFSVGIDYVLDIFGYHAFNPKSDFINALVQLLVQVFSERVLTLISSVFMSPVCGFNPEQFDLALLPIILGRFPVTVSKKQLVHYAQLIKSGTFWLPGEFKQYDHGILKNQEVYGSINPPTYDLSNIKTPVHLYYSENDLLSNVVVCISIYITIYYFKYLQAS